jgi:haloalkane dehalogenase
VPARIVRRPWSHPRDAEAAAYGAPFPSVEYQAGALVFPRLVPTRADHPGAYDNRVALETLRGLDLPVLLPWSEGDPITRAAEAQLRTVFRNVAPPLLIAGAGHFIQEDAGEEVAGHIRRWMKTAGAVREPSYGYVRISGAVVVDRSPRA